MEAQVWESHQRDRLYQEETPARVWWQTRGGAAKQEAAGKKGKDVLDTQITFLHTQNADSSGLVRNIGFICDPVPQNLK